MTISIAEWRYQSIQKIKESQESADIEINAILTFVLNKELAWCLSHSETMLSPDQKSEMDDKLFQLVEGIPLPYILGKVNFYNSSFIVNQNVLIPRPETELMVENAILWIETHSNVRKIVDVGTGSGAIILSVQKLFPEINGYAVDISKDALSVALINKKLLALNRPDFVQMDCLSAFKTKFDVILANLPYIPSADLFDLDVSENEPLLALNGGSDGLEIIKKLVNQLPDFISSPGIILLEIQFDQGQIVTSLVQNSLPDAKIGLIKDFAGLDRIVRIEV